MPLFKDSMSRNLSRAQVITAVLQAKLALLQQKAVWVLEQRTVESLAKQQGLAGRRRVS
jgi:hypothetical protein